MRLGVLFCFGVFLTAGAIRVDQYVLRYRAERLLSDIRSLELRRSSYADARKVIDRWWDDAREDGPCRPDWCDVEIGICNLGWCHSEFFINHQGILNLYRRLGGRPASAYASIRVRDQKVWEKGLRVIVESTYSREPDGSRFYHSLIADTGTESPWPFRPSPLHPEYEVGEPGGCTGCAEIYAHFTPYADPVDVRRLMDINLSCITQWHPCTNQVEILPTAWKEAEEERRRPGRGDREICTPAMIRTLSRGVERVPLATVTKVEQSPTGIAVTVRRNDSAKKSDFTYHSRQSTFTEPGSRQFRIGERLLLFDDECFAVPTTKENLKSAQQGVSEDWTVSMYPDYLPSFGAIKPPRIDVR